MDIKFRFLLSKTQQTQIVRFIRRVFFHRTSQVLGQVFLAFRVPAFKAAFWESMVGAGQRQTASELNPFTFQDEPKAQN